MNISTRRQKLCKLTIDANSFILLCVLYLYMFTSDDLLSCTLLYMACTNLYNIHNRSNISIAYHITTKLLAHTSFVGT